MTEHWNPIQQLLQGLRETALEGLNADSGDAEREALAEIGQALGLEYDDNHEKYIDPKKEGSDESHVQG